MSTENNLKSCSFCVGNAAAMLKALRYIIKQIDKNPKMLSAGQLLCIIGDKAEAAISAPARNCDRYKDAETARQAWLYDADNWDDFGSSKLELHEWLFAPAKE